jgi:hypothetical protein
MDLDGLAFEIQIGSDTVPAWLPLMPDRFAAYTAFRSAIGFDTDGAIADEDGHPDDFVAVLAGCVVLCWGGSPLSLVLHTAKGPKAVVAPPGPTALRGFRRDFVGFGAASIDALMAAGYGMGEIIEAGKMCHTAIVSSIPTDDDVEEAAKNSKAPAGASIADTSNSA